MTLLYWKCC